jgi:sugar lactone lactonase YvrE
MAEYEVKRVLDIKAKLGECPVWSVEEQMLYWVDIEGQTVNRFDPASGHNQSWDVPGRPGCLALREDGSAIVAAQHGIYVIDFDTGVLTKIVEPPFDGETMRFNDGQVDRQGRLWVGSMIIDFRNMQPDKAVMYCLDGTTLSPKIAPITVANGTAFSPDGRVMYRAESERHEILAYDLDPETAQLSNERVFARMPEEIGMPDGATVDSEGAYWTAAPNPYKAGVNGSIVRFTPDGIIDLRIETPIAAPTMVAFGGPSMSTLYVTSVADELIGLPNPSPLSGNLFAIETTFTGIPHTKVPVHDRVSAGAA